LPLEVPEIPRVRIWIDPACPWAWQTALWLRDLRDRGVVSLEWKLFSLELNSSERDAPFWEASQRYGEAHVALVLARREGGDAAFEAYYAAYGALRHDQRLELSPELAHKAAVDADMPDVVQRAVDDPGAAQEVREEYLAARELDVFGVPTIQLVPGGSVIYGPILPLAPKDDEALAWWSHVRFALERSDLYELKRWPRDRRPGQPEDPGSLTSA
jgi:predicted DsbA family dithiol-disulfide isomerase